ncbi:hypothetical protein GCM10022281_16940 [Sphingomonas rosea]|jgi:hypothetical protein|uniref:Uncharacterized protein n=1 Tax=Sphingomonas rosea TaxID=335605 RepID=A0ABP7U6V1_9SPHN
MIALCLGIIALLVFVPDIPLSRTLHVWLVALPAERLETLDRKRLFFLIALAMFFAAGAEMMVLIGSAEIAATLAWQIALYADAVTATIVAAVLVRTRPAITYVAARTMGLVRRASRRRRTCKPTGRAAANDDDPAPARTLAA